ncbi:hypothetical protein FEM48_Zijuj05G0034700 [Ziziphus jujuba var. spinosa]|uniref:rRNA methylase YtqB n=1 Tax=Ziziphus jujuba var. spinosa TaxID=714518 RepID=A0A978VCJ9_ZIZJJ|nr:hypothetical protein FEM48_Zijuj05G0034700 [Ziziphus jujuba var. spinosa]
MLSARCVWWWGVRSLGGHKLLVSSMRKFPNTCCSPRYLSSLCCCFQPIQRTAFQASAAASTSQGASDAFSSTAVPEVPAISGLEDVMLSYIFGNKKATEVAHLIWERIVRKGDTVIDATCGNGYDTLALLRMVADESGQGRVYGFDVQKVALENASSLLEVSVNPNEKELVKLFHKCHSKMAEVLPEDTSVRNAKIIAEFDGLNIFRLIAFNLGYLPGGDKSVVTESQTTAEALTVAKEILMPGGLISLVVYVGHPGGREELETVEEFCCKLPVENWTCCKIQMLNRQLAPILVFLFKKC